MFIITEKTSSSTGKIIKFSVSDNCKDTRPKNLELPLSEFIKFFDHPLIAADYQKLGLTPRIRDIKGGAKEDPKELLKKSWSAGFYAAHFDGKGREEKNILFKDAIILDVDNYHAVFEQNYDALKTNIKRDLKEYEYIVHTTCSHTFENPKIRIIILLDREIPPSDYKNISTNFVKKIITFNQEKNKISALDAASFKANQMMYFPFRHKENPDYQHDFWHNEGKLANPDDFNIKPTPTLSKKTLAAVQNTENKVVAKKKTDNKATIEQINAFLDANPATNLSRNDWLEVGMAFHHHTEGSAMGFFAWFEWSEEDQKIAEKGRYKNQTVEQTCKTAWNSFDSNRDNLKTFKSLVSTWREKAREKTLERIGQQKSKFNKEIPNEAWVDRDAKGKVRYTYNNLKVLMLEYELSIAYDSVTKAQLTYIDGVRERDTNYFYSLVEQLCILNKIQDHNIYKALIMLAKENTINSVLEVATEKKWDGVDRIEAICNSISVEPEFEELKKIYITKWLIQMIHLTCFNSEENPKQGRHVLVFQGAQERGKTTWLASLAPKKWRRGWVMDGVAINVTNEMDKKRCSEKVFVEFGELGATFRKSDLDMLKSFLSATENNVNVKYLANPVISIRQTSFFGTVNDETFLKDPTGNSRFFAIPIISCNTHHGIDVQQLYAQLYEEHEYTNYNLSDEEKLMRDNLNQRFVEESPLEEVFKIIFDINKQPRNSLLTSGEVLGYLGYKHDSIQFKKQRIEMGRILDKFKFKRFKTNNKTGWLLPTVEKDSEYFVKLSHIQGRQTPDIPHSHKIN